MHLSSRLAGRGGRGTAAVGAYCKISSCNVTSNAAGAGSSSSLRKAGREQLSRATATGSLTTDHCRHH